MKTLVLVRHGKASHSHPELEDIDRPLTHRGKKDSERMSEWFHDLGIHVHAVISSPAFRATETAEYFAAREVLPVEVDERLYNADAVELLDIVQSLEDYRETVVLVGHNPVCSDFLRRLLDNDHPDMPTAGVAVIDFDVHEWMEIHVGGGSLEQFQSPKTLDENNRAV